MWEKLATSELLSTFFTTWLWQGREWRKGRIPKYDPYYWGNAHAHPVVSTYYPFAIISSALCSSKKMLLDRAYCCFIALFTSHIIFGFASWFWLFNSFSDPMPSLFGALTITFGAYSLKQQPCIIYTLTWFPLTLVTSNVIATIAVAMVLTGGYYPFAVYLLSCSAIVRMLWFGDIPMVILTFGLGCVMALPQLVPFLKHLPKTIKRLNDKCEETPEVERWFYVGVIPLILIPFSTSRVWPLILVSAIFALGFMRRFFPRVHERWLIVTQFGIGWASVSALNNLNLSTIQLVVLLGVHAFDLYWHNRECLPPRPYCELWQRPSRAFNTKLTRFLEQNLGDYKVSGLPWPLFTGHINKLKTIGYCGSMQTKEMWSWRKSFNHDPFIDGVDKDELTRRGVLFAYSRKTLDWPRTVIPNLYRNPNL